MKEHKFLRSALALLLVVSFFIGMVPAVFATGSGDRLQVSIDASELPEAEENAEAYEEDMVNALYEQTGFTPEEEEDPEFGTLQNLDPEGKGTTRGDSIDTSYVFLDMKPGYKSRYFNWQIASDSTKDNYFATYEQGVLAGYFWGSNSYLYMPMETHANYINARLNEYVLKSGDIAQVRVYGITANELVVSGNTATVPSYFAVHSSGNVGAWQAFGTNRQLTLAPMSQTLTWTVKTELVGQTLHGVRWDPSQEDLTEETRIYVDYIYVGPASSAPVRVEYRNEANSSNLGYHYVGYGKKAEAFSTGQVNSETDSTRTIWGWRVLEYTDGVWTDKNQFLTDPSTYTCTKDTRFILTKVVVPKNAPRSEQICTTGVSVEDDKYTIGVNATGYYEGPETEYGTPMDISILLDRSGSQGDLVTSYKCSTASQVTARLEQLSKAVAPGYYRATCFRQNKHDGTATGVSGFLYTMPMRYYRGKWQMQVLRSCTCNATYHASYGIYDFLETLKPCSHVKWVTVEEGFKLFSTYAANTGFTVGKSASYNGKTETLTFNFGISRLGRAQNAIDTFLSKLYRSSVNLKPGESHSVSVIGYGGTVFADRYPFDNLMGSYVTAIGKNYSDCTKASSTVDVTNYEKILKTIRDPYIYGATRTDCAFQVLSGKVSTLEAEAGRTSATLQKTDYLPTPTRMRKSVVILMTDGVPTKTLAFDNTIATNAIQASKLLKDKETTVFAVCAMDDLEEGKFYTAAYATGTEAQRANNFMNLISSRYPAATAYNTPGSKVVKDAYFIADTAAGSELSEIFSDVWNKVEGDSQASDSTIVAPLWLHEEFSRQWTLDDEIPIRIYAESYAGNDRFKEKVLIAEHAVRLSGSSQIIRGNGYELHVEGFEAGGFSCSLKWTDNRKAFLRETPLSIGALLQTGTGSVNVAYGYRISMEIPVEVDRSNTMGGNNIPMTTGASGFYASADVSGREKGLKLAQYPVVNANVLCSVGSQWGDYFIPAEDYIRLLQSDEGMLKTILEKMVHLPETLQPANNQGLSNLDYVSFDVELRSAQGDVLFRKAADFRDISLRYDVYNLRDGYVDLWHDHVFTLSVNLSHRTCEIDSFGCPPQQDLNVTVNPTYYVPKFAVMDFAGSVSIPLGEEGKDPSRISSVVGGIYDPYSESITVEFGTEAIPEETVVASYSYKAQNRPLGASSDYVTREVYLIPGNVVTYDDTVVTPVSGEWYFAGSRAPYTVDYDNESFHGYESYIRDDMHSYDAAIMGDISGFDKPEAMFTFTGSGFELLSVLSDDAGLMLVEIYEGNNTTERNPVEVYLADPHTTDEVSYQVPIVRWNGLWGTYTVKVKGYGSSLPSYISKYDEVERPEILREYFGYDPSVFFHYMPSAYMRSIDYHPEYGWKLYIDGVRVFNPIKNDPIAEILYLMAGEELQANFIPAADVLLHKDNWVSGKLDEGILFMDGKQSIARTGVCAGNEIRLDEGFGVAFGSESEKLMLSLRSADGRECQVQIWDPARNQWTDYWYPELNHLTSTTGMFYDFSQYRDCLILRNAGEGTLALSVVKTEDMTIDGVGMPLYVDDTIADLAAELLSEPVVSEIRPQGILMYPVDEGYLYFDTETQTVVGYDGMLVHVVVPSTIFGIPVLGIGERALSNNYFILDVTIEEGVEFIADYGFADLPHLTEIHLPSTIRSIGKGAFSHCSCLESVNLSEGPESIGDYAFEHCYSLTSIEIPGSVTSIGNYAFDHCEALATVMISHGVESVGYGAFSNCEYLRGIYYMGSKSMWERINIESQIARVYYLGYAYPVVGGNLYYDPETGYITGADTTVTRAYIPATIHGYNIYGIDDYAFELCRDLTELSLASEVCYVSDSAFVGCTSLYSFFYEGTKAEWHTFGSCDYPYAFSDVGIRFAGETYVVYGGDIYVNVEDGEVTGCDYNVTEAEIFSTYWDRELVRIGDYAFADCTELTTLTIPETITSIGWYAFEDCNALTDVYYNGTRAMWDQIIIETGNESLLNATIHCLPEPEEPTEPSEPEEPAAPEVVEELKPYHSLNLQSNISINYVVPVEVLNQYDSYEIKCYVADKLSTPKAEERDGYVYFILTDINALQMNVMVRAELYAYKDGKTYVSPLDSYSIVTYATNMMSRAVPEQVKRMCANLLRYGAASQLYMGYDVENLADAGLTEEQKGYLVDLDTVEFENHYAVLDDLNDPKVTWAGKTLMLDSTVAIKLAVDASGYEGNAEDLELRFTYTDIDGEERVGTAKATVYNAERKLYMFVIDQLEATELRTVLYCQVFAGDEAVSQTMTYSADSYCNGKTGALLELCKALFAYVDEARAYFGG